VVIGQHRLNNGKEAIVIQWHLSAACQLRGLKALVICLCPRELIVVELDDRTSYQDAEGAIVEVAVITLVRSDTVYATTSLVGWLPAIIERLKATLSAIVRRRGRLLEDITDE
jgi:hypothetical protein